MASWGADRWWSHTPAFQERRRPAEQPLPARAVTTTPSRAMCVGGYLLREGLASGASRQAAAALGCALFKMIIAEDATHTRCDSVAAASGNDPVVRTAFAAQRVLAEHFGQNFSTLAEGLKAARPVLPQRVARRLDLLNKAASVIRHTVDLDSGLLKDLSEALAARKLAADVVEFPGPGQDPFLDETAPMEAPTPTAGATGDPLCSRSDFVLHSPRNEDLLDVFERINWTSSGGSVEVAQQHMRDGLDDEAEQWLIAWKRSFDERVPSAEAFAAELFHVQCAADTFVVLDHMHRAYDGTSKEEAFADDMPSD